MTDYPRWKRTEIFGVAYADDWCLHIDAKRTIARLYRVTGGPTDGQWFWAVQIDQEGGPFNAGTGYAASGGEARDEVEKRLAERFRPASRGAAI